MTGTNTSQDNRTTTKKSPCGCTDNVTPASNDCGCGCQETGTPLLHQHLF
jgi:hypothetical protein